MAASIPRPETADSGGGQWLNSESAAGPSKKQVLVDDDDGLVRRSNFHGSLTRPTTNEATKYCCVADNSH